MSEPATPVQLPYLDVFSEAYARDPYPLIAQARAEGPVARSDRGLEFLGHKTAQMVLMDRRFNSGMQMLLGQQGITEGPMWDLMVLSMLGAEGDLHRRLRNSVMPYFNAGAAAHFRAASRQYVTTWLTDALEDGECDFAAVVGRRLPATLFCDMVGAPHDDWEFVADVSEGILKVFTFSPGVGEIATAALLRGHEYLTGLIEERRHRLGDDLISAMLGARGADRVSDAEILDLALTILGGSTDNTNSQMALNLMSLAENPGAWRQLKQDRSLIAAAALEGARWKPGQLSGFRVAEETIELEGVTIEPGQVVNTNTYAANRDPSVYEDADRFDLERKQVPGLNFGHGRHFCLGRPIALVELEEALAVALDLWSEYEIGDVEIWGAPFSLRAERLPIRFELEERAFAPA